MAPAQEKGEAIDFAAADAQYEPFKPFSTWLEHERDSKEWDRYAARARELRDVPKERLAQGFALVRRMAAIETGAIEGLYKVERGFTFSVAAQTAAWEALVRAKGRPGSDLISSQLKAYDHILDFATGERQLSESWIRELHEVICTGQETHTVQTPNGLQEHELRLGEYKRHPNHVYTADRVHSYCPVERTPDEMGRLLEELRSDSFQEAHPVLQIAFSHHALTYIHPFSDGNGRVARAVASVFMCRATSVPLLILAEDRGAYFQALSLADAGNLGPWLGYVHQRGIDAIRLVEESIERAGIPPVDESMDALDRAYRTTGGYDFREVETAAAELSTLALGELKAAAASAKKKSAARLTIRVMPGSTQTRTGEREEVRATTSEAKGKAYRHPLNSSVGGVEVTVDLHEPLRGRFSVRYYVLVPEDCARDDTVELVDGGGHSRPLDARVEAVVPETTGATVVLTRMWAEGEVSRIILKAARKADRMARTKGHKPKGDGEGNP